MTFCGLLFFNLLLLLGVVGLPLHGGKADVELLDDGGVQAVEVEQQHELVVETYDVTESESHTHAHTRVKLEKLRTENQTHQLWDPAPGLQRRPPSSSACPSQRRHPRSRRSAEARGSSLSRDRAFKLRATGLPSRCLPYHFQLGLLKGGLVGHDVVFLCEGVEQEELVPLRAAAHQCARLPGEGHGSH